MSRNENLTLFVDFKDFHFEFFHPSYPLCIKPFNVPNIPWKYGSLMSYLCTVIWIFPKGSDFGNEWQILFAVAWGQQNAISRTDYVAFDMFHRRVTNSRHRSFFILQKKSRKYEWKNMSNWCTLGKLQPA